MGGRRRYFGIQLWVMQLLLLCLHDSHGGSLEFVYNTQRYSLPDQIVSGRLQSISLLKHDAALSPASSPQSIPINFQPLLAPSPLSPLQNNSAPKLSGLCMLNFSAAENMVELTAIDCWSSFAPFLATVMCCPQLQATLTVLVGQYSKTSGFLALDMNHANHCLSDIQMILASQGANDNLQQLCGIQPSNLSQNSCPIKDINEFEGALDVSKLLAACSHVDAVKECCSQVCQNAVSEAARRIALTDSALSLPADSLNSSHATAIEDCKSIVYRWIASRLEPDGAKQVLRRISNCNVNKVCPLHFPSTKNVSKECGGVVKNHSACCKGLRSYISHLQKQTFITNLQALDCAALFGMQLQNANISQNIYDLCQITLKDFTVQVGLEESGCLLPSLPSDATFDSSSGRFSFTCDLNDNIAAPWPSSLVSTFSCNKSITLPALPAATPSYAGLRRKPVSLLLLTSLAFIMVV